MRGGLVVNSVKATKANEKAASHDQEELSEPIANEEKGGATFWEAFERLSLGLAALITT